MRGEVEHLVFERVRAERPPMTENNRLAGTPIIEEDFRSIFGREFSHLSLSIDLPKG